MSDLKQNIDAILSETSDRICNLILESVTKNQCNSIVKELEPVLDIKLDIDQTAQVSKVILIKKESIQKITFGNYVFGKLVREISQIKDEYIDIVKFTGDKNLMLICCAYMGNLEVVKFLVESGADIHADNDYALRLSAHKGHFEVVKFLVESGADIHTDNDYPLRLSAHTGHFEVVKILIESGANIHAQNDYALRWSVEYDHLEVVKFLVKQYVINNKPIPDSTITRKNNDSNRIMFMYAKPEQEKLFNQELVKMLTPIKSILN